ncbi:MAG: hypothetical protein HY049_12730 [Acidobacteria bacterium]|nr:hypothetical protein [Acidobacteriota bacterium]
MAVAACAVMHPDLVGIYHGEARPRRAVVFIPGVFGSRLRDSITGRVVWGNAVSFLAKLYRPSHPGKDLLDLPIDADDPLRNRDGLVPDGPIEKVAGHEYYLKLIRALRDAGGFVPGDIHDPRPGADLYAFDYDWRRDVPETAAALGAAIDRVLSARGDPGGKVDLVAHSLGGLVARYYVRHGGRDVLAGEPSAPTFAGAPHVGTVILLGTPNGGTLDALRSLLEGERVPRLLPPEAIFTMPAAYQLLPAPGPSYLVDVDGAPVADDIYDVATWEKLGWSVFSPDARRDLRDKLRARIGREGSEKVYLERMEASRRFARWALDRARRFREALEGEWDLEGRVRYAALGGDCTPTPSRAVVQFDGSAYHTYFDPADLPPGLGTPALSGVMSAPGDDTVTRASLLQGVPTPTAMFLCESHKGLTQSPAFHDAILHLLLEP